jgi:hypothetical protein
MNPTLLAAMQKAGIVFMGGAPADFQAEGASLRLAHDGSFACDAQPSLITVSNSGIPAYLNTYVDPKLIEVLVTPMKAVEIVGDEAKKGDWITPTAAFPMIESTGATTTYGDYNEAGQASANFQFPQRQSYHYQVMTRWGEREMDQAGLARIDWANRLNIASALTLNKKQNKTYFFGVSNLQNYGLLNDPNLPASISPTTKVAGGTGAANATGDEILNDIAKLYQQLVSQTKGLIDRNTKMVLAMSPTSDGTALTKTTQYNVSVQDRIKKIYPNMEVRTAPEYSTQSGELVQLIVPELEGQQTATCAFTEKMRAHPIIVGVSNWKQKKSQGTWGCVIFRPFLIAQMLGW